MNKKEIFAYSLIGTGICMLISKIHDEKKWKKEFKNGLDSAKRTAQGYLDKHIRNL